MHGLLTVCQSEPRAARSSSLSQPAQAGGPEERRGRASQRDNIHIPYRVAVAASHVAVCDVMAAIMMMQPPRSATIMPCRKLAG